MFLLDVANDVERERLEQWVRSTDPRPEGAPDPALVAVSLERAGQPDAGATADALERAGDSTEVVPLRMLWIPEGGPERTGPRLADLLLGDPRRPRPWVARLTLRRHPERARCIAGRSATLAELRRRYDELHRTADGVEDLGQFTWRQAGIALDVEERQWWGRRYKVPRSVPQGVQAGPRFKAAVAELAAQLGRPPAELTEEARGYLAEMVATPSTFFIDWTGKVTRWITSLGYGQVVTDPGNVARTRQVVSDHPSAFLWSHKSHVDNIALMSALYEHDFPTPHSFGGINMAFGGIGFLGRRAGVIFIRRSFQDNPVYKLTLRQYVGYLMDKRFPFSWSFEGTRSRNGKLMPPRYGILKYVVDAAHATGTHDLALVPVSINYDLIGEATDYAVEEAGHAKQAESLSWFLGYLRRLRSPLGQVYIDFAEPVLVEGAAPASEGAELSQLAFEVARRVNALVPVTLPSLMCMTLLGAAPRALTLQELDARMRLLLAWLGERGVRTVPALARADVDQLSGLAEIVYQRGLIQRHDEGPETVLAIGADQYPVASYYRNTIVHYFLDKAMAELALLSVADQPSESRVDAFREQVRWLRDALKFEFFHTPSETFPAVIEAELASHDPEWQHTLTIEGSVDLVARMQPVVAHSVLQPYVESYGIVAELFARLEPDQTMNAEECVARSLGYAQQALLQQRISSRASIGKQMFTNAYSLMEHEGLVEPGGEEVRTGREALAVTFADLAERLATARELALAEARGSADREPVA